MPTETKGFIEKGNQMSEGEMKKNSNEERKKVIKPKTMT